MSDTRLRKLERRWRATGAVDDEVAYLRERIRIGELRSDLLELGEHCGIEVAKVAQQDELGDSTDNPETPTGFIYGFEPFEAEALNRAVCSVALQAYVEAMRLDPDLNADIYARSLRTYIIRTIRAILKTAAEARRPNDELNNMELATDVGSDQQKVMSATYAGNCAFLCATSTDDMERFDQATRAIEHAIAACNDIETSRGDFNNIRERAGQDVFAWALGNDPLPAQLARLEAEAANATPTTPPG